MILNKIKIFKNITKFELIRIIFFHKINSRFLALVIVRIHNKKPVKPCAKSCDVVYFELML